MVEPTMANFRLGLGVHRDDSFDGWSRRSIRTGFGEKPLPASRETKSESGAVLILVLVFTVVVAVIAGALASWAINDLSNVAKFRAVGSKLYAAGGATEVAIRASRYTYSCPAGTTVSCTYPCPGTTTPITINTFTVQDWCTTTVNAGVSRVVVLTAYLLPSPSNSLSGPGMINGSTHVPAVLTATVYFNDNPPSYNPANPTCTSSNESTCGINMQIVSWVAQ
jgi:hypothetical protein